MNTTHNTHRSVIHSHFVRLNEMVREPELAKVEKEMEVYLKKLNIL